MSFFARYLNYRRQSTDMEPNQKSIIDYIREGIEQKKIIIEHIKKGKVHELPSIGIKIS